MSSEEAATPPEYLLGSVLGVNWRSFSVRSLLEDVMRCRNALFFVIAALSPSCAEPGGVVGPRGRSVDASVDGVARAFARGLAQPDVRAAVRDAMRASPLTEHKLSLREFVGRRAGDRLVRAAALKTGVEGADLLGVIASLPDMDFYVPIRQQRLTWQGTADYVVTVNLHGRAPTFGYDRNGDKVPLDLSGSEPPPQVVVMLQAAETKSPRILPQRNEPGLVIQDPDDGGLSGSLVITDRRGGQRTVFLADLVDPKVGTINWAKCYEECDGGSGGGGSPPPQTYLERIATQGVCDNGFCWETNEFEFRAMTPSGVTNAIRIEGIESTEDRYLHMHLIYAIPPMWVGGQNGTIAARETDSFGYDLFFLTGLGYCGAVPLDGNEDNLVWWYLTEGTCDEFAFKSLVVMYTW